MTIKQFKSIFSRASRFWLVASMVLSSMLFAIPQGRIQADTALSAPPTGEMPPWSIQAQAPHELSTTMRTGLAADPLPPQKYSMAQASSRAYQLAQQQVKPALLVAAMAASRANEPARDQNRAEVSEVSYFLNPYNWDFIWGTAEADSDVTINLPEDTINLHSNESGHWELENAIQLQPGDSITVTAGLGLTPFTFVIPNPIIIDANSGTDKVSGTITGWNEKNVDVESAWDFQFTSVETDASGYFEVIYDDLPYGGEGAVHFGEMVGDTTLNQNVYYRTLDPVLVVRYDANYIEGEYLAGHDIVITVKDSADVVKGTANMTSQEIPWWDGRTGFTTDLDDPWEGDRPDIVPGDTVYADVDDGAYTGSVTVGSINAAVNMDTDSISGTIDAAWLPDDITVEITCDAWGAKDWAESKGDNVFPDNSDTFNCAWDPIDEWDIQGGQEVGVSYRQEGGHRIQSGFRDYVEEIHLRVNRTHNWIEGDYNAGHDVELTITDAADNIKATGEMVTGTIPWWNGGTGFHSNLMTWDPYQVQLEVGDHVLADIDDGSFTTEVEIGHTTGTVDIDTDSISGTIDAAWLVRSEVQVECLAWGSPDGQAPNKSDTVTPDGVDTYTCSWDKDTEWDVIPGQDIAVLYVEPAGHAIMFEVFRAPASYVRIGHYVDGSGNVGEGGNATLNIWFENDGDADAADVTITDTLDGFTYLSDTSGVTPTVIGNVVTWELGTLAPKTQQNFQVFVSVDALESETVTSTVEISTSNMYDMSQEEERRAEYSQTVSINNTHLNVGQYPWTWAPAVGERYVYEVNVCNNGNTGSTELTLTDSLAGNASLVTWWSDQPGWTEISSAADELVLEHPSIAGWTCQQVYIQAEVDADADMGDSLSNDIVIAADNDIETDDNQNTYQHPVGGPEVELTVDIYDAGGELVPGGNSYVNIDFHNNGNIGIDDTITITATLPEGFHLNDFYVKSPASVTLSSNVDNVVTWEIDDLYAGYFGTIELMYMHIPEDIVPGTALTFTTDITELPEEVLTHNNHSSLEVMVNDHGPNLGVAVWGEWRGDGDGHYAQYEVTLQNIGDELVDDVELRVDYDTAVELDGGIDFDYWMGWAWEDHPTEHYFTVQLEAVDPNSRVMLRFSTNIPGSDSISSGAGV